MQMRHLRRHKRWRRHSPVSGAVQSAVWMIGLGVLFLTGWWWPGILIVAGLSMVAGALAHGGETLVEGWDGPPPPAVPPVAPPPSPSPFETRAEVPTASPNPPMFRTEPATPRAHLPDLCPNCGAPTRSLRGHGGPTECPYCGSEIGITE